MSNDKEESSNSEDAIPINAEDAENRESDGDDVSDEKARETEDSTGLQSVKGDSREEGFPGHNSDVCMCVIFIKNKGFFCCFVEFVLAE